MRRTHLIGALLGAAVATTGLSTADSAQATTLTVGTLAPKKSPWGKVFNAWAKAVKRKSNGSLKLRWYYNGGQGDEGAMVAKMRSGQLDGAAVTSVGLSKIYKNILILQSPGLFSGWASLDKARNALMPQFQKGLASEGFRLVGTGDVGLARTMSKGKAIKTPGDLKSMKVYKWTEDTIAPVTARVIGYTAVGSSVPGLLPALSSGRINVITVPALAATQLQWWSHLDHVNKNVAGVGIGGLVFSKKAMRRVPADQKAMFIKTGKKAGKLLTKKIRKEDRKAFKTIKRRMKVVSLSGAQKGRWRAVFKKVRRELAQGVFPASLMKKVERYAD